MKLRAYRCEQAPSLRSIEWTKQIARLYKQTYEWGDGAAQQIAAGRSYLSSWLVLARRSPASPVCGGTTCGG